MDMEKILTYVENIAENLEGLINTLGCDRIPSEGAIYVDGKQNVNYVSTEEAMDMLDSFCNRSSFEMIGKSDYMLIYDADKKLVINGEAYLPSGYMVMKSSNGLRALDEEDIRKVISELGSRMTTLAIGGYRIQAYRLG